MKGRGVRTIVVVLIAVGVAAMNPAPAWAEVASSNTSNVGPIGTGPTVSNGSAGFNESGTQAQADSRTGQGIPSILSLQPGASINSKLTYTPILNGVAPGGGPVPLFAACPPGNTPYAVFDPTGTLV